VIAAVPAWAIGELMPEITAPSEFAPIVNLHFGSTRHRCR
jgi:hypothetical protein